MLITHEADIAQHAHRVIHLIDGAVEREDINPEPTEADEVRVSIRTGVDGGAAWVAKRARRYEAAALPCPGAARRLGCAPSMRAEAFAPARRSRRAANVKTMVCPSSVVGAKSSEGVVGDGEVGELSSQPTENATSAKVKTRILPISPPCPRRNCCARGTARHLSTPSQGILTCIKAIEIRYVRAEWFRCGREWPRRGTLGRWFASR